MAKFNKDSVGGTLTVVVLLSLVCSLIVAGAAVLLKPTQEIQKQLDKQKNILQAAGLMQENTNVQDTYAKFIEPKIVDLATGDYVDGITNFDAKAAAKDPAQSIQIAQADDRANIKVRAKYAEVYLVKDENGKVVQAVLPMYGNGLWSIMYGLVAVQSDANTINGITYYEQGETAGLGGEIANPVCEQHKETPVILVCATGVTSSTSAEILAKQGFNHVYTLKEGLAGWRAANLPLVRK